MTALPTLIPRRVLFGNPTKTNPQISPSGTHVAYLAPVDNVLNVWVGDLDGANARPVTHDCDRGIRLYFWAADGQHILYLQDVGGDENWRLYAVNLGTMTVRDLTPFPEVQVQVVDRDKHFPNELLIAMNKEDPRVHDVYHLDLPSGTLRLVAKNRGDIASWVTDAALRVRGATAATPDGGFELLVRDTEAGEWNPILKWGPDDSLNSQPVGFSRSGTSLYLEDSRHADTSRLVELDLATGNLKVLADDPRYVGGVLIHPDTYEIQAVAFDRARTEWTVLDDAIHEDFAHIAQLHHGDFSIISRDHADRTWVVAFTADDGPAAFYAYDRSTRQGRLLFYSKPDLSAYPLAPMEPITVTSRDGFTLHGYLTFPPGLGRARLPLVVNVHGGPHARDTWGFDPEAQWLANRGYACLQVNFRGSTGYGKRFLNAGDKEWGGKMHDDLVDAVRWAVDQGIADPRKVAIYGASYGGYAALIGATFTPDLFCCAVDVVGPSNLITMIQTIPPYWSTFIAVEHRRVGNPETETEFLKSRSPLFRVDRIKRPILIAHGANDPRVKQAESEQIVEAMKRKGIPYEYLLFPDEGHGFAKPENRLRFYAVAERFLAQHLGGRFEPEGSAAADLDGR
ncbi:MAG: S9 family peptidase [Nitrospirae bacterium]|nr:S9 family peptidase [Nitrospirota bacterium]